MDVCLIPFRITPVSDIALPNKLFEYSACGKPILSTPLPDVIKVGAENLFVYKDKEEFVDKVKYIMNNPRKYEMDVNEYSWKRKARELESLLQELIEGKK
jgi:glycosyltransferase involved in cell wall biosynthesis